jgi:GH25 family lysozyme M1 (1,4-beta-N-acetylmuramidase)
MSQYKDLQSAFGNDDYLYIKHFVEYGMSEGRIASEDFDPVVYAQSYSDLVNAFGDDMKMYYLHYIRNGKAEGRVISKTFYDGTDYEAVFDFEYYKNAYSDLKAAFGDNSRAYLAHFVNYGMKEGRNASENFDIAYYSTAYEDLKKAFGSDLEAYYLHYINYGKAEGREALPSETSEGILTAGSIGIDVSHHQKTIDWEAVKNDGISFAIIRVGYGSDEQSQDDKTAAYNISECERLNIPYGVYLYSYAISEEEAQSEAEHLLRLLDGHNPQLGVYIDIEDTSYYEKYGEFDVYSEEGRQRVTTYAKIVMEAVTKAGYEAGIYANYDYYTNVLKLEMLEGCRWVALWNNEKQKDVDDLDAFIWQYADDGEVDGVEGSVDMDLLMKDVVLKTAQTEITK